LLLKNSSLTAGCGGPMFVIQATWGDRGRRIVVPGYNSVRLYLKNKLKGKRTWFK
jgi:hypothetical protein